MLEAFFAEAHLNVIYLNKVRVKSFQISNTLRFTKCQALREIKCEINFEHVWRTASFDDSIQLTFQNVLNYVGSLVSNRNICSLQA